MQWLCTGVIVGLLAALAGGAAAPARASEAASAAGPLQVASIEFGLFARPGEAKPWFQPATTVPFVVDQAYGWVIMLRMPHKTVRVLEELTLPTEPKTWGDPEPGVKRRVSADGRTATSELTLAPENGVIQQAWAVAPGDPKGEYVLKLQVEGEPARVFRFTVR